MPDRARLRTPELLARAAFPVTSPALRRAVEGASHTLGPQQCVCVPTLPPRVSSVWRLGITAPVTAISAFAVRLTPTLQPRVCAEYGPYARVKRNARRRIVFCASPDA